MITVFSSRKNLENTPQFSSALRSGIHFQTLSHTDALYRKVCLMACQTLSMSLQAQFVCVICYLGLLLKGNFPPKVIPNVKLNNNNSSSPTTHSRLSVVLLICSSAILDWHSGGGISTVVYCLISGGGKGGIFERNLQCCYCQPSSSLFWKPCIWFLQVSAQFAITEFCFLVPLITVYQLSDHKHLITKNSQFTEVPGPCDECA